MEQQAFKNVNSCWNSKTILYLETSGGEIYFLHLNVVNFFQHQFYLDICRSLRHLSFCIGVYYVLFCSVGKDQHFFDHTYEDSSEPNLLNPCP